MQAHRDLESAQSLGIHYGTFALADDGQQQPVAELAAAVAEQGLEPSAFTAAEFGTAVVVPPLSPSSSCPP